jgi:F-type H+-transporting ATPase subunit b
MNGLIDIRLVLTQVLAFLLLVWIMGRFAWRPLVAMLEARRKRIADDLAAAEQSKRLAEELRLKYEQDLRGIEARARERLQEVVAEGQRVAGEMKHQAQADATARIERANDEIEREREKAKEMLKEQVAHLSIRTAEKILRAQLDDANQRKLVNAYIDEVGGLR